MSRSAVRSSRTTTVPFRNPHSRQMSAIVSSSIDFSFTVGLTTRPPRFAFESTTSAGFWFNRMFARYSSSTMTCTFVSNTSTSRRMRSHPRVTLRTSRPRPFPFAAPWISPGMSRIWIFAPRYSITPGITVTVVNAYAATSLVASVIWFRRVDFPVLGKPTRPTVACPLFFTAYPGPPPPLFICRSCSSSLRRAIFAFSFPMWCWVFLLYGVFWISSSIALI